VTRKPWSGKTKKVPDLVLRFVFEETALTRVNHVCDNKPFDQNSCGSRESSSRHFDYKASGEASLASSTKKWISEHSLTCHD
jgi:hypothetical protein